MNLAESTGGSSCKGQENGDASNGSERPLKKARFAWQVKGKHHLKNDASDTVQPTAAESTDPDTAGSSGSGSNSNSIGTEQNLEILGDYLLKQDFNTLDSVIADPDKSHLKPSTSISTEKLQYPRYVSSYESANSNNVLRTATNSNELESVPMSMVVSQNYSEDQCIARWQARQMAKGFVDNTINRVLDSWIQIPYPPEEDGSRFIALDVADFINNLPSDNSIENEGILMAISAHGLQNTSNSSSSSCKDAVETCETKSAANHSPSPQRSLSPIPSDDESQEQINSNNQCDTDNSSNDLDLPWSYSDDQRNESNDMTPFPLFPDASSLSYQYLSENHHNSNPACDGVANVVDNNCDFLDTAVLFAIQSKGLTTFGTDYG